MPCLIVLLLLGLPRLTLFLIWIFSPTHWIGRAFEAHGNLIPFLGFLFLPFTTLAYAWSINTYGAVQGLGLAAVVIALLLDLGLIGASRRRRPAA
jgi:hypothetical protein